MTSEEAAERIETIKMTLEECIEGEDDVSYITSDDASALDMAIEILEQEPVLDKIRAEIKALNPEPTAYDVVDGNPIKDAVWETLADVLKIIDKYKEESEDKECTRKA